MTETYISVLLHQTKQAKKIGSTLFVGIASFVYMKTTFMVYLFFLFYFIKLIIIIINMSRTRLNLPDKFYSLFVKIAKRKKKAKENTYRRRRRIVWHWFLLVLQIRHKYKDINIMLRQIVKQ